MYVSSKLPLPLILILAVATLQSPAQTPSGEKAVASPAPAIHAVALQGPRSSKTQAKTETAGASVAAVPTHERFVTFLADEGFKSELLLQNSRLDTPVTARPALILERGEVPLDPVVLAPHAEVTVDINSALQTRGLAPARGLAVVRYDFSTYAALSAVVTASDVAHHLYLNFAGQSGEEFWSGNTFDAVVWAPDRDAEGFLSIINTYSEPRTVRATFTVPGRADEVRLIAVAPHQQRLVRIDPIVRRSSESGAGAGIHLEFAGQPGEIVAEGMLLNKQTGFSKHIQFTNKALHFATQSRRTHFLLLGRQPVEDSFPAQIAFRSVAVVRNIDSAPIEVVPVVRYLKDGSVHKATLGTVNLGVNESRLIDFNEEKRFGRLPADFFQGSLELSPNTTHTSIVSELFNFDERNRGYVVGPSFAAHPMRSTSSIWRIDGTFQTTIMIENTADQDDRVSVKLFSDQGTYEKIVDVAKGDLVKINVKELQQKQIPDKDGNLLLATSGTLHLSGSRGGRSALAYDKLIHSSNDSEYVGLPSQPCDFVTDFDPSLEGSENPYTPVITEFWTDGTTDTIAVPPVSENSSLVSVGSDSFGNPLVVINGSPDGLSHTVGLDFTDIVLDCTACSDREQEHTLPVTVPACPTSLSVANVLPFDLNNGTADGSFPQLKSGLGAVALMQGSPSVFNVPITESVSLLTPADLCPNFPGHNICRGSDTFLTGTSLNASEFGVPTPVVPGAFYDTHLFADSTSVLDVAGINSCTFSCGQTYSCSGRQIGAFQINFSLSKGNINGTPVTKVTVTKH